MRSSIMRARLCYFMSLEINLFFKTFFEWSLDLGLALVGGLILSGLLFAFLGEGQTGLISKFLAIPENTRKKSFLNALKVALIGVPMPLCSCSVIPVVQTLRKKGLSQSSVSAFLTTTPETSPTSFLLSWTMLGPAMAILRPLASLIMGVSTALAIAFFARDSQSVASATSSNCCECDDNHQHAAPGLSWKQKLIKGFKFAFVDVLDDFGYWPLLGLAIGAAVSVWVPMGALEKASGFFGRLAIILVSVPIYVCAESSTPIAPGLLAKGLSAGAVFLFLMAGPLSNLSSLLTLRKVFGTRFLALHVGVNTAVALLLSYVVDMLYKNYGWALSGTQVLQDKENERSTFLLVISLIGMGLLVHSSYRAIKKMFSKKDKDEDNCCSG